MELATSRLRNLTSDEAALFADVIDDSLSFFGLRLPPNCDLARMRDALRWLGSFQCEDDVISVAYRTDRRRAVKSALLVEQGKRIALTLAFARDIRGSEAIVPRLKKKIDRLQTQDELAQDLLFELEIAHRLSRFHEVSMEEPDIVIHHEGLRIGLACKRPRGVASMGKHIVKGASQIQAAQIPGIVVVGLEPFFHKSPERGSSVLVYQVENLEALKVAAGAMSQEAASACHKAISEAFSLGVHGVLFCGLITALGRRPSALLYYWCRQVVPNSALPNLAAALECLIFHQDA